MTGTVDATREREPVSRQRGIAFAELREGRCKFPLGNISDPPEWFCGEPAPLGKAVSGDSLQSPREAQIEAAGA